MPNREMPAIFLWADGREDRASIELDAHELPPYTADHMGHTFHLERVSSPGTAVYVQRRLGD